MDIHGLARRIFLQRAAGLAISGAGTLSAVPRTLFAQAPAIVTADSARPSSAFGVTAGDVDGGRAIIWSRTDRPARLIVEYATTESFSHARRVVGPAALETTDFTARVDLSDLPVGQRIFYRVQFQSLRDLRASSQPMTGTFTTPDDEGAASRASGRASGDASGRASSSAPSGSPGRAAPRDVTIAWTADTVGQGWGINTEMGGMRLYEAMRAVSADLFVHTGDTIYADGPLQAEVALDDGRVWRNLVTPEKSKVAETLDEFRGNHRYNLLDEHVRRFNASVSQFVIWDDHETLNNWYPTETLDDPRYTERSVALLAARARRAFQEYTPMRVDPRDPERIYRACRLGPLAEVFGFDMRSYRGANSANRQPTTSEDSAMLGGAQVAWLKRRLEASRAVWKIVASDMPLGLTVTDGPAAFEAVANGDGGPPAGRELEIAHLLTFIRDRRIRNVVFITGDVHYCAAHHYDPARAAFTAFDPFWEFVAGPAHAGTFGAPALDRTFGPEVRFIGIPPGMKPNRPPSEGLQFFGTLRADAKTSALTVTLHNLNGDTLYTVDLPDARK